jgi:hypothetical protein
MSIETEGTLTYPKIFAVETHHISQLNPLQTFTHFSEIHVNIIHRSDIEIFKPKFCVWAT